MRNYFIIENIIDMLKKFDKRRLGYLHMIYFKSNMSLFGEWKCENKYLAKYDYLMIIDDDPLV